jgi:hypothetical protein
MDSIVLNGKPLLPNECPESNVVHLRIAVTVHHLDCKSVLLQQTDRGCNELEERGSPQKQAASALVSGSEVSMRGVRKEKLGHVFERIRCKVVWL